MQSELVDMVEPDLKLDVTSLQIPFIMSALCIFLNGVSSTGAMQKEGGADGILPKGTLGRFFCRRVFCAVPECESFWCLSSGLKHFFQKAKGCHQYHFCFCQALVSLLGNACASRGVYLTLGWANGLADKQS